MSSDKKVRRVLKAINNYLTIFLFVAFVITCCMLLFLSVLSAALDIVFTEELVTSAAKLTFGNVVLLSLIFSTIDIVRRRLTVERPVKRITDAASKIMRGDFSVRIEKDKGFISDDRFDEVIDCFNKMATELGSVETLRTDFVANVSHEMKTPLAVMQNYAKLLQTPGLPEEKRIEYAKAISTSSSRMAEMMTNILKLNRLENGQIFPEKTVYDLGEQLCECMLRYENVWEESGIEISCDIAEDVKIKADREMLSLVWNNLLSNAFKFTERGGTVSVSLVVDDELATVIVRDTGCGMTREVGNRIFEKFYQGETSHSGEGNGLGLALVKQVIDIVGAEISVESELGVGTSFTVRLQREAA